MLVLIIRLGLQVLYFYEKKFILIINDDKTSGKYLTRC